VNHPTVKVKCPYGWKKGKLVPIDAKLAPLIREVWKADIWTCQCCQDEYPGLAAIEFPGTAEVEEFLDVAQRPYRVELETWDEGEDGVLSIAVRLLVLFPAADIPRLVKAFAKHNARPKSN
jgi:hypothetical protein